MSKDLRIVFFGTPTFAVESLKILLEANYNIVGVITAPDKPSGRGQKINSTAVKIYAETKAIPILQPNNLKDEQFLSELRKLEANLQIVVAFRMLPDVVWQMPMLGTFNLHASLLPQYRGAAPINWAIINGEKETGVSTFFLQHQIDTGKIIFQERTRIEKNETAGELHDKLMYLGAKLVLKTVQHIENESINPQPQRTDLPLKVAYKIFKPFCEIDWSKSLNEIYNHIRGLSPYPTAFSSFIHKKTTKIIFFKIFKSKIIIEKHNLPNGTILFTKDELNIAIHDGFISILELQPEGKKRMLTSQFLNGFSLIDWELNINKSI